MALHLKYTQYAAGNIHFSLFLHQVPVDCAPAEISGPPTRAAHCEAVFPLT